MVIVDDIAPKLLKEIQKDFQSLFNDNAKIVNLYGKVKNGTATYVEANDFAIETGETLAKVFQRNLSSSVLPDGKMYYNIAKRIVEPMMSNNYDLISEVTQQVQTSLNQSASIGIKAIQPKLNHDRIDGIINKVSDAAQFDDVAWVLEEPIVNFSQSIVDDSIKTNAEFQAKAGMQPVIERKVSGNCCDWCKAVAGTYRYPNDVPHDVYRRHQRCRCTVDYNPGNGKIQNVHSKKWQTQEERDRIEKRKVIGLIAEDDVIMKNIRENVIPKQNIDRVVERQQIHRVGTKMYEQRKTSLQNKEQYGPSYLMISDEEVLELVRKYSGKGQIKYARNGEWNSQEIILTNDKIVGVVVDNRSGVSVETSVFKIHYSKDGIHIVPDYPSKKRRVYDI